MREVAAAVTEGIGMAGLEKYRGRSGRWNGGNISNTTKHKENKTTTNKIINHTERITVAS